MNRGLWRRILYTNNKQYVSTRCKGYINICLRKNIPNKFKKKKFVIKTGAIEMESVSDISLKIKFRKQQYFFGNSDTRRVKATFSIVCDKGQLH